MIAGVSRDRDVVDRPLPAESAEWAVKTESIEGPVVEAVPFLRLRLILGLGYRDGAAFELVLLGKPLQPIVLAFLP